MAVKVMTPQWRTTRELYQQGVEVNRELAQVMEPDDLLRLSCSVLAQELERRARALEHKLERGV
jgi:hypothetical protein